MRTIGIQQRRWWGTSGHTSTVPSSFSEMTPDVFLAWVAWNLRPSEHRQLEFLRRFWGLSGSELARLDSFQTYTLAGTCDFLNRTDAEVDRFLIPSLPGPGHFTFSPRLTAPADRLEGVSLQQYMTVDTFFAYFAATKDEQYLNRMVAALYLLPDESFFPDGKHTRPLKLAERERYVSGLPYVRRYAIFVNWSFIRTWLTRMFPSMFSRSAPEGKPTPPDWLALFDAFVGEHVSEMPSYQSMPCMDAFRIINRKIKESRKQKRI